MLSQAQHHPMQTAISAVPVSLVKWFIHSIKVEIMALRNPRMLISILGEQEIDTKVKNSPANGELKVP